MELATILMHEQATDIYDISRIVPNLKKMGKAKFTLTIVEQRIRRVNELWKVIKTRHASLLTLVSAEDQKKSTYFTSNQLEMCMALVDDILDYLHENQVSLTPPVSSAEPLQTAHSASVKPCLPLPTLDVPKFDGSSNQWESFRNRFESLIISNKRLRDYERMHYLSSSLTGEALDVISHLAISESNFSLAWEELKEHFEHERELITEHLRSLFAIPQLKPKSAQCIRGMRATIKAVLHALHRLNRPVEHWDDLLVFLVTSKMDSATLADWELMMRSTKKYPTYSELDTFLENRSRMLISLTVRTGQPDDAVRPIKPGKGTNNRMSSMTITTTRTCSLCNKDHPLYRCSTFLSRSVIMRRQFLIEKKRCMNCFSSGHAVTNCPSKYRCKECKGKHHTLIHTGDESTQSSSDASSPNQPAVNASATSAVSLMTSTDLINRTAMLATARVRLRSSQGRSACVRAILDQGSQVTLISENVAQLMRLPRTRVSIDFGGFSACREVARQAAIISVGPVSGGEVTPFVAAIILPSLTTYSTQCIRINPQWTQLKGLNLADDDLTGSDPIDILIGVNLYSALLRDGLRIGRPDESIAQNTILGWIVSGALPSSESSPPCIAHLSSSSRNQINFDLQRFWEVGTIPAVIPLPPEERQCEEHFAATHSRNPDGRYVVRVPFRSGPPVNLGESRSTALASLVRLERRFQRDATTKAAYAEFLNEYERLGHMTEVPTEDTTPSDQINYIPHHAVLRESSSATRLRVVFNASSKTSNGLSLNDCQLPGPKLQTDLCAVILRWRQY